MIGAIFSQAIREYTRFRRLVIWLLLGALCFAMAHYWGALSHGATPAESYASVSSVLVFHILALASAIFTTAIVSQEVEGRTIVYLLTRPVPRWQLLIVRFAASVIVVACLGFVMIYWTSLGAFGLKSNPLLFNDLKAVALGALGYGGLFLLVSLVVNRAMIYCLLFSFGWETSVPSLQGDLYHLSINTYIQAVAQHPVNAASRSLSAAGGDNANSVTALTGALTLTAVAVVTVLISCWWFTHFEFVPREDAE
jgi:ABC-2 type transport system permease protein